MEDELTGPLSFVHWYTTDQYCPMPPITHCDYFALGWHIQMYAFFYLYLYLLDQPQMQTSTNQMLNNIYLVIFVTI